MSEHIRIPTDMTNFLEIASSRCDEVEDVESCVDMFIIAVNSLAVIDITGLRGALIQHCLVHHDMVD